MDKDGLHPPSHLCMETYFPASTAVGFLKYPATWGPNRRAEAVLNPESPLSTEANALISQVGVQKGGSNGIVIPQVQQLTSTPSSHIVTK